MKRPLVLSLIICIGLISCHKSGNPSASTPVTPPNNADIQTIKITPSTTDGNINTFTDAATQQHLCYIDTKVAQRNQLMVFLPGSNGTPVAYEYFDQLAATLGYQVIGLMYPDSPSVGMMVQNSTDPNCFYNVRMEIIDGTDRGTLVSVNRANSIENRLIKCIKYLNANYPTQNWGQYLDANDNLLWGKIVVAGHSQGGGNAALIAKNHVVARILCFSAPHDTYVTTTGAPANWINTANLTPPTSYYTFTHGADNGAEASPAQQQTIYTALGLRTIADSIGVDNHNPPYNNSRILMTHLTKANGIAIVPHTCVVQDSDIPDLASGGANKFQAVWTYMLTN